MPIFGGVPVVTLIITVNLFTVVILIIPVTPVIPVNLVVLVIPVILVKFQSSKPAFQSSQPF